MKGDFNMSQMKKVSVIVPAYKVEKYIGYCLDSILSQSYKNIEVIIVDDGSPDDSGKIAEEYARKDERVRVLHKENGGLSAARNDGMDLATGDYLMFIDSDDFLLSGAISTMTNKIAESGADYVIANYINSNDDGVLWEKPVFNVEKYKGFELSIKDYEDSFFIMNSSVCNKIYDFNFVKRIGVRFEVGLPAEDAIFNTYCFIKSEKVCYIPDVVYC